MKPKCGLVIATIGIVSFAISVLGAELSAKASALPEELRKGLVLYYSFDSEPGTMEIADESGQGNNGHPVSVEWIKDGHRGGAANFGMTNSYITVPDRTKLNPDVLTLSVWIKTSYKDGAWRRIFDKGYDDGYALTMGGDNKNGGSWQGQVCLRAGKMWASSGFQVTDGQWHHVIGTCDGADAKLYVDGKLVTTSHWLGKVPRTTYDLTIGENRSKFGSVAHLNAVGASFNGRMDDVMMFNRALSDGEVQALFKAQGGVLGEKLGKPVPVARAPARPSAQNKQSADERLKQVKQLFDQGLIDKENYDRKVKEIVDSI